MQGFRQLDNLLRTQSADTAAPTPASEVYAYARAMADIEGTIAVVTDLATQTSRIFNGAFAAVLGLEEYREENSIWEKKILSLMPESDREEKFLAELRFYNSVRHRPKRHRHFYLMTRLRMTAATGMLINVLHRMHYVYDTDSDRIRYALCLYGPLAIDFAARSLIVNTLTGTVEELTSSADKSILSRRHRQILAMIDSGLTSEDIACRLSISRYTVNRHRQEIISRLQVRNSIEACRIAKSMKLI